MAGSVTDNNYTCSLCSKVQNQVKRLIAGPDRVFICDECVELCGQIISQDANADSKRQKSDLSRPEVNPKWIHSKLNEYVIGQEKAKKVLSVLNVVRKPSVSTQYLRLILHLVIKILGGIKERSIERNI